MLQYAETINSLPTQPHPVLFRETQFLKLDARKTVGCQNFSVKFKGLHLLSLMLNFSETSLAYTQIIAQTHP